MFGRGRYLSVTMRSPAPQPATAEQEALTFGARLRAFYELTKPGIAFYVMLTAGSSAYLGGLGSPDLTFILGVMAGVGLASAGALALNQYIERQADAVMRRTRTRPIPTGRVRPREGAIFGLALLVAGLVWLLLWAGPLPASLTAASAAIYHGVYRPLKSHSYLATFAGSVPGALPMLIGWTASTASFDFPGGSLFAIGYLWQLPHVLGLAWMLREDYSRVGFRLIPQGGARTIGVHMIVATALLIPVSLLPFFAGVTGGVYAAAAVVLGCLFLLRASRAGARLTTGGARKVFRTSLLYHPLLLLFMVLDAAPAPAEASALSQEARPRAREIGLVVGVLEPGAYNAITDVAGVRVGHSTLADGERFNTGVTAIIPHGGNPFESRVPAAIHVGNGFGKLLGVTQVRELGELETPILLTCTLCVWRVADAMVEWMLGQAGMEDVRSINPVVGETNDGGLNDIRERPVTPEMVVEALETASGGAVEEGAVGAGAGTVAFGWKGGIGTSSRVLPESLGGYAVGALVQSNYGGVLSMNGAPVGIETGRYSFSRAIGSSTPGEDADRADEEGENPPDRSKDAGGASAVEAGDGPGDGSVMIVVATDAPLSDRNLERLARRAVMGLARTGSFASNGSGDYVIAFSTAEEVRRLARAGVREVAELGNGATGALFMAAVEATEEAIYNSLLKARTTSTDTRTVEALPLDETIAILRRYGALGGER